MSPYLPPQNDAELFDAIERRLALMHTEDPSRVMAMLGARIISVDFANRSARFEYPLANWMLNAEDILHGGVLSAIFDNSMGTLTRSFTAKSSRTLNLQVSFTAPIALCEGAVRVESRLTNVTNRFSHLFATAWGAAGTPAATATAIFYLK